MRGHLIAVAVVAGLVGCGVPSEDQASTATGPDVPYGLLEPADVTTPSISERSTRKVTIWLAASNRVVPIVREVELPVTISDVYDALVAGPTASEATLGLRSAIATDVVGAADIAAGVATVELQPAFTAATPRDQLLALAQLVYTATELDAVQVVRFTLDGQPVDVPRGDGSISNGPVTRRDYAALVTS